MSEFWYTKETMLSVHNGEYEAFQLFDATHCAWLFLCFVICVGGFLLYRSFSLAKRKQVLIVLTILLLADELLKYVATIPTGQFRYDYLPLHVCSINVFVCTWYTLKPNKLAAEILYALSLPGGLIALLSPTWTCLPVWNVMHLHSETIHIMLTLYPVLLLAGGFRPDYHNIPKVFGCLALAALPIYAFNCFTGTNFMFLNYNENNPVLLLIESIFKQAYILGLILFLFVAWAGLYAPWALSAHHRKSNVK